MIHVLRSSATASVCAFLWLAVVACENEENQRGTPDPQSDASPAVDGGVTATQDGGGLLKPFTPPPANPGPATALFTISGEALASEGFAFPPAAGQEVKFVDGWDVSLSHVLVTVDAITLSDGPDTDSNDPTKTGAVIAQADGPWAVDLATKDPAYPAAKGGEGKAIPLAALSNANRVGGGKFDTAGTRYAFGFKTLAATTNAMNVNLGSEALAAYERMIAAGCSMFYMGTATWKGDANGNTCTPAPGSNAALDALPKVVDFELCFRAPTENVNCQNPDNDPAAPLGGEEHQRGVAFKENTFTTAQLTVHVDHSFWISVEEDSPASFDQLAVAAKASGGGGNAKVTMSDLEAVDFGAVRNAAGVALPWRNCVGADFSPPAGNMAMYAGSVQNVGPSGNPAVGLRHLADYVTFVTSTQGHLNADGVCFVKRSYVSPN